jgi:hypothetical protein
MEVCIELNLTNAIIYHEKMTVLGISAEDQAKCVSAIKLYAVIVHFCNIMFHSMYFLSSHCVQ